MAEARPCGTARARGVDAARARFGARIDDVVAWYAVGDPGEPSEGAPPWLDPARCDRGGLVLRRFGLLSAAVLRCYALPLSYRSPAGILPLLHTGALVSEAPGRLYRTAGMVMEAQQPGALHPGGPGWRTAAHVRAMHARVRESLWQAGWDARLGAPIPQPDLAATALLFGPLTVEGLRTLGASITEAEADDVAHLVRAMAHGQGVVDDLQVDTHAEALELFAQITSLDGPCNAEGAALMHALLEIPHGLARRRVDHLVAPVLRRIYEDLAIATLGHDAAPLGVVDGGSWATWVRRLTRLGWHHHPRMAPVHDRLVASVIARGRRRLQA